MLSRKTDNPERTSHYKKCCKVLTEVINLAKKKSNYNKLILNSKNRIKILWDIIKAATNSNPGNNSVPSRNIEGKLCNNGQIGANAINNYFSAPLPQTQSTISSNPLQFLSYLLKVFKHPFPNISMTPVTTKEIKAVIKSLKC
jgi:hypothetical protein